MIERKIEVEKDNVVKSIEEKLLSTYIHMGWSKVEPKVEKKTTLLSKSEK